MFPSPPKSEDTQKVKQASSFPLYDSLRFCKWETEKPGRGEERKLGMQPEKALFQRAIGKGGLGALLADCDGKWFGESLR